MYKRVEKRERERERERVMYLMEKRISLDGI